jgi:hypothetical protein
MPKQFVINMREQGASNSVKALPPLSSLRKQETIKNAKAPPSTPLPLSLLLRE